MRRFPSIKPLALAIGVMLSSSYSTLHAAPELSLGLPAPGDIETGVMNITGWATDSTTITSISVFIDGAAKGNLGHGGSRPDVAAAFPDNPDAIASGFSGVIGTRNLGNGQHTLVIVATNALGETTTVTRSFYVSNAPWTKGSTSSWTDEIDLDNATVKISNQRIFIDGAVLNGVVYDNLALKFNDRTVGFEIVSFVDDEDGDGFHDDDLDEDGFHDGDEDLDGFHDDDENFDGFVDDDDGSDDDDDGSDDDDDGSDDDDDGSDDDDDGSDDDDDGSDDDDDGSDDDDDGSDDDDDGSDDDDDGSDDDDDGSDDDDDGSDDDDDGSDDGEDDDEEEEDDN